MASLDELIEIRRSKLDALLQKGIDPYPAKAFPKTANNDIIHNFSHWDGKEVSVAGRVMSKREHGKIAFIDIKDDAETLQLFFSREFLSDEAFASLEMLDIGDFIGAKGEVFKTSRDAISVRVKEFTLLSKALRPIPSEHFGLEDTEEKLRRRYVDLIVNNDTREIFRKKSTFINSMRQFLLTHGFIEVDTSILELKTGGAEANPFVTHHDTLDQDFYLRISLELQLKRLLVGGYEKVFEIGKVFRNEGMDKSHLQEFIMMECYWAYADYEALMRFIQNMYQHMLEQTFHTLSFSYNGKEIQFSGEWARLDYTTALKDAGVDLSKLPDTQSITKVAQQMGFSADPTAGRNRWIDRLYKKLVRPYIIQPTFLINQPVDVSPLAKRRKDDPTLTERFQIVFVGEEVGNGFSELNDPIDQKNRFLEQQKLRDSGDNEAQMMDEDFIEALEYGMPPTAGFGVGPERFFEIITDASSIRDVVLFPPVRTEDNG